MFFLCFFLWSSDVLPPFSSLFVLYMLMDISSAEEVLPSDQSPSITTRQSGTKQLLVWHLPPDDFSFLRSKCSDFFFLSCFVLLLHFSMLSFFHILIQIYKYIFFTLGTRIQKNIHRYIFWRHVNVFTFRKICP